jgi:hypothetical protein
MIAHKPPKKTVTKVWVERIDDGYCIKVMNSRKQVLVAKEHPVLQEALTEAADFADFYSIRMTPFMDGTTLVEPEVLNHRYDDFKRVDASTLASTYRLKTGELNWNSLIHWEWSKYRKSDERAHNCNFGHQEGFAEKTDFLAWLLPVYVPLLETRSLTPVEERAWLGDNANGDWSHAKNGYRFNDDRDAVLFKLFCQ